MMKSFLFLVVTLFLIGTFGSTTFTPVHAAVTNKVGTSSAALVGWWTFDEGTSTLAHDFSGNGNTGTLTNFSIPSTATSGWTTGKRGRALVFNGSNNYVPAGNGPSVNFTSALTVSVWVNYSDLAGRTIASKWGNVATADYSWLLFSNWFGSGQVHFLVSGNGSGYTTVSSPANYIKTGQWYHIVGVYDGSTEKLYINGVLVGTTGGAPASMKISAAPVTVGADYDNGGSVFRFFNGKIDDLRVYNQALSIGDIQALYKSGEVVRKLRNNTGLVAYWPLDEGTSTIAHDFSGGGLGGTLSNGATWVQGRKGNAVSFDGVTGKITAGSLTVGTNMTISAWIYKNSSTGQKSFFSNRNGGVVYFGLSGTQIFLFDNNGSPSGVTSPSGTVAIGRWQHIVATSDGSTLKFYLNGSLVQSTAQTRAASTGTVGIGWDPNIGTEFWDGKIDEVQVYSRTFSVSEVTALYNQNATKLQSDQKLKVANGLVGYWSFNGKDINWTTNTAYDTSGSGNNLTFTNLSSAVSTMAGKSGQALNFEGTNSRASVSTAAFNKVDGQPLTVSVWIYPRRLAGLYQDVVVNRSSSGVYNWMLYQHTTDGSIQLHGNSQYKSSYIPPLNTWTHIVATVDAAGNYNLYANGVVVQTISSYNYHAQSPSVLAVGAMGDGTEPYLGGIDEVRVYNRALSATEAKSLYLMGK